MITIANPEKYRAGLYERLSNENIEVASGEVVVSKDDELESGSISTQKIFNEDFCKQRNIYIYLWCSHQCRYFFVELNIDLFYHI